MTVEDRPTPDAPTVRAAPRETLRSELGGRRLWFAAAFVVGVVCVLAPVLTLVVLAVAVALAVALWAPRATAGVAVLGILFVRPLEHVIALDAVSYLDEALVLLCVLTMPLRRIAAGRPLRTFPGQWWFTGFLTMGLLSGLVAQVPPRITLVGAFLIGKGLLVAWAVAQLEWTEREVAVAARVGTGVILFGLAACVGNLLLPGVWDAVLVSDPNAVEARSGLPSLVGPFTHPIDLGQFMSLAAVAVACWRAAVGRSLSTLALLAATSAGAVLTARRTAVGSLAAAWVWLQATVRSTRVLVALAACLPVALVVLLGPVVQVAQSTYQDYLGNGTPEARTVLTVDSFRVAAAHFPVGAGFGRFGSATAAVNYSPEYEARGYPTIWGLGRTQEDGRFLTDTEWPAIIGESGFLGAAMFALGLLAIYRAGRRLTRGSDRPLLRWAGLALSGWLVAVLVQSGATVSFTGPPVCGVFFALVGMVTVLGDREDAHSRSTPGTASRLRVSRTFSP